MKFTELKLISPILKALEKESYTEPTPIQAQAIPAALEGRDVLGCAQTGTGKTAAFSIPIIQRLTSQGGKAQGKRRIRSLILTPTRELAIQIEDNIRAYSQFTDIRCFSIVGGVSQRAQEIQLARGMDILIATPGRLIDLINQKHADLQHVEILVLDEADRMLDMGFINDVKKIMARIPAKKQTLFFSATMPPEISRLVESLLHDPVKVEITPVSSTVDRIDQSVYFVDKDSKPQLLIHLLRDRSIESVLVFTRTKHGADRVVRVLTKAGITAQAIHGNKSQNARQAALGNFKSGATRVLVATDIAARGIDIDELAHVIQFNLPNIPETYVHRIGRTGRAGKSGTAIAFCEDEEVPYLKDIEKLTKKKVPVVSDHPYPMAGGEPVLPSLSQSQGGGNARQGGGSQQRDGGNARQGGGSQQQGGGNARQGVRPQSGGARQGGGSQQQGGGNARQGGRPQPSGQSQQRPAAGGSEAQQPGAAGAGRKRKRRRGGSGRGPASAGTAPSAQGARSGQPRG
ncbi:ATP-dependent RNA helicase RhlE [Paenibacillus pasadenensis]|uniref:ATP-dependent RNA helicase CshA n=1 Tax=Paenibacillus pasadenensis TaxID=217090 RepID=A0A2N5NCQ9_9BACL|nr:DEAD/DEAH box helicase [Paenibacillus pasadenensis]PLT48139.1 ATP-dependent RNA helicase RhlE [Paenibacillus pasadenensis]